MLTSAGTSPRPSARVSTSMFAGSGPTSSAGHVRREPLGRHVRDRCRTTVICKISSMLYPPICACAWALQ